MRDYTEDEYYGHIVGQLEEDENPLVDHVASLVEWQRCKAALLRWIAEQDAQWDRTARDQEHETDG